MSLAFTKDEVRDHLIDLGYSNLNEDQLKDFMMDLKRLIKYEERHKNIQDLKAKSTLLAFPSSKAKAPINVSSSSTSKDELEGLSPIRRIRSPVKRKPQNAQNIGGVTGLEMSKGPSVSIQPQNDPNEKENSENAQIVSSTTMITKKKKIRQRKVTRFRDGSLRMDESFGASYEEESIMSSARSTSADSGRSTSYSSSHDSVDHNGGHYHSETASEINLRIHIPSDAHGFKRSHSLASLDPPKRSNIPEKPTTSFIRPVIEKPKPKDLRSDPVKLYHFYKSHWDKTNFPGDNSTKDVRWCVREMMNKPKQ